MKLLSAALLLSFGAFAQATDVYQIAFLRPAADRKPLAKEEGERIQKAHMANILDMAARGVLVAAGPFGDKTPTISGIFVFKVPTLTDARKIAEIDATVIEHRNTVDVLSWRGPKGIGEEYMRLHKADPKTPEDMGVHPFVMLHHGAAWDATSAALRAHDEYVAALRRDGKLAAAGPVEGNAGMHSIVILARISDEEAERLIAEDPAVKAGVLRAESHRWWSAAHVLP